MGEGWPSQVLASGSGPGHPGWQSGRGPPGVSLLLHPKRNWPMSSPETRPWEADHLSGRKEAVIQILIQTLEAVGSKSSPLLPLQPPHVLLSLSRGQLSRAFLFLEYTQSCPHQDLVLWLPPSGTRALKILSAQGCYALHTLAQSLFCREPPLPTRPVPPRPGHRKCSEPRTWCFQTDGGQVTVFVLCGCRTNDPTR